MTGDRHGPNRFADYEQVHNSNMQMLALEGFVLDEDLRFQPLGNKQIALTGVVRCQGQIVVEVDKILAVQEGSGPSAIVQTTAYRYHARIPGRGNIVRYENSDHNKFDHVHRFDFFAGDHRGTFQRIDDRNEVPTLGDLLRELRDWYEGHADRIEGASL